MNSLTTSVSVPTTAASPPMTAIVVARVRCMPARRSRLTSGLSNAASSSAMISGMTTMVSRPSSPSRKYSTIPMAMKRQAQAAAMRSGRGTNWSSSPPSAAAMGR